MKIAIAQINTTVGDLQGNYEKIIQYINKAKQCECDIVVFPELALSGYPPEDLLLKDHFIQEQFEYGQKLINTVKDIIIVFGFIHSYRNKLYNTCSAYYNQKGLAKHDKHHLPNYSVFDEQRYFSKGYNTDTSFFHYKDKKIAINICEDIWINDGISKEQSKEAPDIMINISCSPYYAGKIHERETLLKKRAVEYNTTIVYCNLVGGQDELVFDGGSMVINKNGTTIGRSPQFVENLMVYNVDDKKHLYIPSLIQDFDIDGEIWEALKLGLGDYIKKNGFQKVVLGMSGGIDSALVAKLAVDTIGEENVVCLSMPSKYSSDGTKSDAELYSKELGVEFQEIPIIELCNEYKYSLMPFFIHEKEDVTEENIQARIRGNIIMAFSNKFGYIPLSTGNKSEVSVGYCTLYGDMIGGFNPIKDLYKTQVYELARYVGVKESIINREPSAELRKDQRDVDSLPPYDVLDKILVKLMEENGTPEGELEKKVAKLLRLSEYKRRQACPGIKITKRSYGKDYRMPIVNGYNA